MTNTQLHYVISIFFASLFIFGCHKPHYDVKIGLIKSYFELPKTKMTGEFSFFCNGINNDTAIDKAAKVAGGFNEIVNLMPTDSGAFLINGRRFINNGNIQYYGDMQNDSLFGRYVTFSLIPLPNIDAAPATVTFYSPKAILITSGPKLEKHFYIHSSSAMTVTWNKDDMNENGVFVSASYNPYHNNDSLKKLGYNKRMENNTTIPDTGGTLLQKSFFDKFPIGASIVLHVGRGNRVVVQNGKNQYELEGVSNASVHATIIK